MVWDAKSIEMQFRSPKIYQISVNKGSLCRQAVIGLQLIEVFKFSSVSIKELRHLWISRKESILTHVKCKVSLTNTVRWNLSVKP